MRPFGVTAIVGGWDSDAAYGVDGEVGSGPSSGSGGKDENTKKGGPGLYMIEPSGLYWGYYGAATGKGRQAAKAELEKLDLATNPPDLRTGIMEAARIIYVAHEDSKDKDFELEITWISNTDGPTKGRHDEVPKELKDAAEKAAKRSIEPQDEEGEGEGEDEAGGEGGERMEE